MGHDLNTATLNCLADVLTSLKLLEVEPGLLAEVTESFYPLSKSFILRVMLLDEVEMTLCY